MISPSISSTRSSSPRMPARPIAWYSSTVNFRRTGFRAMIALLPDGVSMHSVEDPLVGSAAAEVAGEVASDLIARGGRVGREKRPGGEEHAGRAVAALES